VSPAATVTERITRVAADELCYVFTVDDPANYTQPWTGETNLLRKNENLLEYACHEANYSLRFISRPVARTTTSELLDGSARASQATRP
jgi:hypothetical protein